MSASSDWVIDLQGLSATHLSGLIVKFKYRDRGWDGEGVPPFPKTLPLDAVVLAKLMNEAMDAFIGALRSSSEKYRCLRCEHRWSPKKQGSEPPRICPKCKSPYWDKPRRE
ncbi:hypothetical protein ANRL2_02433 [Anaerolineae bacterium]|nr:hypothetical protein ANRL2_02433 [Anaerolineae bacterium]